MPDVVTPDLKITQMADGGQNNTWGDVLNADLQRIEDKVVKRTALALTGGTTTLSDTDELVLLLDASGVLISNSTVVFSGRKGFWLFRNACTGPFTLTAKVTGQPGVVLAQGGVAVVYCNGTDIAVAGTLTALSSDLTAGAFYIDFNDLVGIKDANGNKVLVFGTTATAVNYLEAKNAATGANPQLIALGGDVDIGLLFTAKGAGLFRFSASLVPNVDGTGDLGSATLGWTNQFFHTGAIINFAAGGATITHVAGVPNRLNFSVVPDVGGSKMALLGTEDQAVTGGGIVTSKAGGVVSSGTFTPDPGARSTHDYTNNGAHTLAPSVNNGHCAVHITNGASAGAITTSGWTKVLGDAFDTTNGHKFIAFVEIGPAGSVLSVVAMQ